MDFSVGSFNLCKFNYQSNEEMAKDIERIAEIIKNNFDIVALQEVVTENVIKRVPELKATLHEESATELLHALSDREWGYTWRSPVSRTAQAAEGYAVLWRKSKFRLATGKRSDERKKTVLPYQARKQYEPRIHNSYKKDEVLYCGRLVRDPLYVRLEAVHSWFEVRLINTHIMFGDTMLNDTVSLSDAKKRQHEFQVLTQIYSRLSEKVYRSCRPSYTILLGDYNLNLERYPEVPPEVFFTDRNHEIHKIVTIQREPTTLKGRSSKDKDQPYPEGFSNNYDHFSYDEVRFQNGEVLTRCSRVDPIHMPGKEYANRKFDNDFDRYRHTVSDHVPIRLDVSLTGHWE